MHSDHLNLTKGKHVRITIGYGANIECVGARTDRGTEGSHHAFVAGPCGVTSTGALQRGQVVGSCSRWLLVPLEVSLHTEITRTECNDDVIASSRRQVECVDESSYIRRLLRTVGTVGIVSKWGCTKAARIIRGGWTKV